MRTLTAVLGALCFWTSSVTAQSAGPTADELLERGAVDSAAVLVEAALAADSGDPHVIYLAGRVEFARGNYGVAFDRFERATERRPAAAPYHYWLGRAYHERMETAAALRKPGLARAAMREFRRAVERDPEHTDARVWLIEYLWRAPGIAGGDREEAARHLDQLARRDRPRSYTLEGSLRFEDGDYRLAAQAYRALLVLDSTNTDARFMLGRIAQQTDQWDAAARWFSGIVERDSTELRAWYQLGRNGALSGERLEEALVAMTRYLRDGPADGGPSLASAHWRRGMIYEHMHRTPEALAEYRGALALEPDHEESRKALERLTHGSE